MSTAAVGPGYYADFNGLDALKKSAKADDPQAIRQAARQFESLLTSMLLKSMREAKLADSMGDSEQTQFYQDMFDQQLALQLSQGKGIGLADMLVQQLTKSGVKPAATQPAQATSAPPPPTAANSVVSTSVQSRFVQQIEPYAAQAARILGVPADALIAQAALETGWGQHLPGGTGDNTSFNYFGVKGGEHWQGQSVSARTVEYHDGSAQVQRQPFRGYGSVGQGVQDYVNLLQGSPRYRHALGTGEDVKAFATGLQRGGYATDPAYVEKLATTAGQVRALRAGVADRQLKLAAGQPSTPVGEIA
ncbi:MAG: glucosaminidase domain-containing protein [Proteobacteria bacterium]|nr:glucosaminidase domain-containing protein [Pseudomonadota bacterium]